MAELPESLKKYLPSSLAVLLTCAWWLFGDSIQKWAQEQITHTPVQVRIESQPDNLYVIQIEATRYAEKPFEDLQIQVRLETKPNDISGELFRRNGAEQSLVAQPTNPASDAFLIEKTAAVGATPGAPITLHQRETIEIRLHEPIGRVVKEVWFYPKEGMPTSSSDLNQKWPLVKIVWRLGAAIFALCAISFLYKVLHDPVVRLLSPKASRRLEEEIEFLHNCWRADATERDRFDREFQPVIDAGTAKYLKIFDPVTRESVRKPIIGQEIFRRARSIPKLRRSLKGEVQRFVIDFCIEMLEHELEELNHQAKAEKAHIR